MKKNLQNTFFTRKTKTNKKSITRVIDDKGKMLLKNTKILHECKNYYQKLYKKQKTCQMAQKELLQNVKTKISNIQNQKLKKQMEISEIE